jgi:4-amino-4-deoxy-L-arabinose transferase-like glycosyltransferase
VLTRAAGQTTARLRAVNSEAVASSGALLAVVAAITVAGLLLRLPSFNDSLFGDELGTYFAVTGHSLGQVIDFSRNFQLNPPLYLILAWATDKLGDPAQSLRLVSLVAGTAAIPLTYLLGLWTVGRRAALAGAALVALSPFMIFYSTEARPYALLLLLDLCSTLCLLRALDSGRFRWWAAYAATSCAAIYTHYPAIFVLAAQFGWAFWTRPDARRALLAANLAAALAYIPWLPTFFQQNSSPAVSVMGAFHPFVLPSARNDFLHWAVGHPFIPLGGLPGGVALAMIGIGLAAALGGLAWKAARIQEGGDRPRPAASTTLVLLLAVAAPVGAALYSLVGNSVFLPRNLIGSWPGLALAIGLLIVSGNRPLRICATALVLGGFAIGAAQMLQAESQRPDYQGAAGYVASTGTPADPVIEVPDLSPAPLTGFDVALATAAGRTRPDRPHLLHLVRAPRVVARRAAHFARGGRSIFIMTSGTPKSIAALGPASALAGVLRALRPRFSVVRTKTFPGFVPLTVYVLRSARAAAG